MQKLLAELEGKDINEVRRRWLGGVWKRVASCVAMFGAAAAAVGAVPPACCPLHCPPACCRLLKPHLSPRLLPCQVIAAGTAKLASVPSGGAVAAGGAAPAAGGAAAAAEEKKEEKVEEEEDEVGFVLQSFDWADWFCLCHWWFLRRRRRRLRKRRMR